MKKKKLLLLIFISLLFFTGCGSNRQYLKDLSYNEFKEMRENKEDFFMVVIQDGCHHCENYIPILTEVLKEYNVTGYTLNLTYLTEEEDDLFFSEYGVDGTPNTLFFKDGKETSIMQRIDGEASKTIIINKLKNNGYIK